MFVAANVCIDGCKALLKLCIRPFPAYGSAPLVNHACKMAVFKQW